MNRKLPPWTGRALHVALCVAAAAVVLLSGTRWLSAGQAESRLDDVTARLTDDVETSDPDAAANAENDDANTPGAEDGPGERRERRGRRGGRDGGDAGGLPDDDPGKAAAQRINERYAFHSRPPERFREIRGVLGDQVLFTHGGAKGVGESFDGAEVIEVGGDWVKLKHNDEEIIVGVTGGQGSYGNAPRRPRRDRTDNQEPDAGPAVAQEAPAETPRARSGQITRDDIDLSKIAAKFGVPLEMLEERFNAMSDDEFARSLEEAGDEVYEFLKD